eukprot:gnl/TRDRNA2_/TRDRNA2_90682_c0_seq1.p1 gnl/TRDRNA2_/TRDRNA2_90682_c0~~gnl/TRDRNA2_/TRDRNA2_90682_c0_seq1.p1  ORF type:complete len:375 (-),score=80.78 gnl/TRDRNA2_/TRDRNA2_90682_c0_seq1:48-1148(-)
MPEPRLPIYTPEAEGFPLSMRLLLEDNEALREKAMEAIAESVGLPRPKVVLLEALAEVDIKSVILVIRLAVCLEPPRKCSERRGRRERFKSAVHDPSSPLGRNFGESIDKEFPMVLHMFECQRRNLVCPKEVEAAELVLGVRSQQAQPELHLRVELWWLAFACTLCACILAVLVLIHIAFFLRRRNETKKRKKKRKGLEETLPSLPHVNVRTDQLPPDETCSICLSALATEGDELLLMPCNHWVHTPCVVDWFERQEQCPLCRCPLNLNECVRQTVAAPDATSDSAVEAAEAPAGSGDSGDNAEEPSPAAEASTRCADNTEPPQPSCAADAIEPQQQSVITVQMADGDGGEITRPQDGHAFTEVSV